MYFWSSRSIGLVRKSILSPYRLVTDIGDVAHRMKDLLARDHPAPGLDSVAIQSGGMIDVSSTAVEFYSCGVNGTFGSKIVEATETSRLLAIRRWRALA
jgi:hypothetical protein